MTDSASPRETSLKSTEISSRKPAALLASVQRGAAPPLFDRGLAAARNRGPDAASSMPCTGSCACAAPAPATAAAIAIPAPIRIRDLPFVYRAPANVEIVTVRPSHW